MDMAVTLGILFLYCMACLCLGAVIVRLLARSYLEKKDAAALSATFFLLGQGVLAAIWQLIAVFGGFSVTVVVGVFALCIVSGIWLTWPILRAFTGQVKDSLVHYARHAPWLWKPLPLLPAILILMVGVTAFQPPPTRDDSMAFYLVLPKLIVATQRLVSYPTYQAFTSVTLQGELHFAALLALNGLAAATLFTWVTTLGMALMLLVIGKTIGLGQRGVWIALFALFTSTAVTGIIPDGKVDLFGTAMGVAAFYWALQTGDEHDQAAVRLAGLFAGLAVAAKVSLAPIVPTSLLVLIWWRYRVSTPGTFRSRPFLRAFFVLTVTFTVWTVIPLIPNAVKNTVLFNAPLAPFISNISAAIRDQSWLDPATALRANLAYPLSLVYGRFWAQLGGLSPLFLAFMPLFLLCPLPHGWSAIWNSKLVQVSITAVLAVSIWVIYRPSVFAPRYIMPPLLILLLVAVVAADRFLEHVPNGVLLHIGIVFVIGVTFWVNFPLFQEPAQRGVQYATHQANGCDFEIKSDDASCRVAAMVNKLAEPGERAFLASFYSYWLRPDLIQCEPTNAEYVKMLNAGSSEARWASLYEDGFHFLMFDKSVPDFKAMYEALDMRQVPSWLTVTTLFEQSYYAAFRIASNDSEHVSKLRCEAANTAGWQVISR